MIISVVIPYFKNAKEIKRTLMSVLNQSFQKFEVLIVNDASPDWSEALLILNEFEDHRIKTISHACNKNGAVARNTGIKAAKGKFIAFLDADDEWKHNHLESLIETIEKENSDVVYSSCTVLSKNDFQYTLPTFHISKSKNMGEYVFTDNGFIQTSCLMIRANITRALLFNPELIRHQDYDFLLRLERAGASFSWSAESTVIVHWEDNDTSKKGGTWEYSLKWLLLYKTYFTSKAYSNFALKFVITKLFQERRILKGLKLFIIYCKPWHISLRDYYFMLSNLFFGKVIVPAFLKKIN